jgi:hypothetical protein
MVDQAVAVLTGTCCAKRQSLQPYAQEGSKKAYCPLFVHRDNQLKYIDNIRKSELARSLK